MLYAITDIETAGHQPGEYPGITEIAVILFDGVRIVDTFHTLVNPECSIQPYVVRLTGITQQMVAAAPTFAEIAEQLDAFTKDAVFVAHAVNFDFTYLSAAFNEVGIEFNRKKLCTVRLSRNIFPGHRSYGLDSICTRLNISFTDRHRALGDATATAKLFEQCLMHDKNGFIKKSLLGNSRETILPPALAREKFDLLPHTTGVYYFHDHHGKVIYVGKAINIKKRITGHFSSRKKRLPFFTAIADITFTLCGTDLIARLLEASEIKKNFPKFNSAQKFPSTLHILTTYTDTRGVQHLVIAKNHRSLHALATFRSFEDARSNIIRIRKEFDLCPRYCGLQHANSACYDYENKACNGVCAGDEPIEIYNQRVTAAITAISAQSESELIIAEGRNHSEKSVVVIDKGVYKGFGYYDAKVHLNTVEDALEYITPQQHTSDIHGILASVK